MIPPKVLIVAGSDSGGGAGIQADIKAVTMLGGHAMTAIAALTAQNTLGVEEVLSVPAAFVLKQMDVVLADLGADAIKIGMIGAAETAEALAHRLESLAGRKVVPAGKDGTAGAGGIPIVFDPVMIASSGSALADEATVAAFERLMGLSTLVTPNAPELATLTGLDIATLEDLEDAALKLSQRTGTAVLAKGGHLPSKRVVDVLVEPGGKIHRWEAERIETLHTHGTGCTLASAIACGLGQGRDLADSVSRARDYVQAAIAAAPGFGGGHGPLGHALGTIPFALATRRVGDP